MFQRVAVLSYGLLAYALFLVSFVYGAGFIGGVLTPTQLDMPAAEFVPVALGINVLLLIVFAVQHSGMARPRFKRWLTRAVPPAAERSTYVLASSVALLLLFACWQPVGGVVWETTGAARVAVYAVFAVGLGVVLWTTFLIDHFDLFGLRQVILFARNRPYTPPAFVMPWPYRQVRHPLYVGWLLTFWAAPTMTASHLVFAVVTTAYILAAIRWEEHDLETFHPEYAAYRRSVPMLVPRVWARPTVDTPTPDAPH